MDVRVHGAAGTYHVPQVRQSLPDGTQVRKGRRLDDGDRGFRVLHAVLERLGTEEVRQRQRDRAHLEEGDVGNGGLRALRQDDRHAVAAFHAKGGERVGEGGGGAVDFLEGELRLRAGLVLPVERAAGGARRPPAATRLRDVEVLG